MAERKVFHDSVVPIPIESGPAPHGLMVQPAAGEHQDEKMMLHFSLALPNEVEADLEEKVARGETVAAGALSEYGAKKADAESLTAWLKAEGFEIEGVSADNTSIYASAPVAQIQKSLEVQMVRVNRDGFTYTAARNAPSLPVPVGEAVQAIGGLQPFRQAHKHSRRRPPRNSNRGSFGGAGDAAPGPSPSVSNSPPYLTREILKAYNADGLNLDGSGQTIAILIDTFPADADMQTFWEQNNLPVTLSQIEKINVSGGQLPPPEGEETLDAQWTSGIAPGATIRIYATGSLQFTALDRALDRIIDDIPTQPGMRQLSISLGLGETYLNGPGGEVATEHQKFLKLAAAGVNVFVSTGDAGSNPDDTGHSPTGPTQAEYESTDPCVIAVGGTTLKLAPDGTVASEVGWSSGGGGKSMYFPRPPWQTGSGVSGRRRLVPDISATADPEDGGFVVLNGHVHQFGGTSWSAPIWAGFCALINSARGKASKPPLPFLNPLIYPLATSCFRDVQTGSNGIYHATEGYDLVTGLGVPNVQELVQALS
ncbi:MAG: protease pro-enzyme activation domain-containing protein [Micromonosporaceae bacterium]